MLMQQTTTMNHTKNPHSTLSTNHNDMYQKMRPSSLSPSRKINTTSFPSPSSSSSNTNSSITTTTSTSSLHKSDSSTILNNIHPKKKNQNTLYNKHETALEPIEALFDHENKNKNQHQHQHHYDTEKNKIKEGDNDDVNDDNDDDEEDHYWTFLRRVKRKRSPSLSSTSSFDISGSELSSIISLSDHDDLMDSEQEEEEEENHSSINEFNNNNVSTSTTTTAINKKKNQTIINPNKKDKTGRSPLFRATTSGHFDQVKSLIANGADVNFPDNAGWTPLHEACLHGHTEIAKYLIKYGAKVNTKGLEGDTPLHDASANRHVDCIQLLIQAQANVFAMNDHQEYPIDVIPTITMNDDEEDECKKLLLQRMKELDQVLFEIQSTTINNTTTTTTTTTPLHKASRQNDLNKVQSILEKGCNVNIKDQDGRTALHEAAKYGHVEIIQLLIKYGAMVCLQSKKGKTALHEACIYHQEPSVQVFIQHGMDLCIKDHQGKIAYECTTYAPIRQLLIMAMDNHSIQQQEIQKCMATSTLPTKRNTRKRKKRNTTYFNSFYQIEPSSTSLPPSSTTYSTRLSREEKKMKDYMRVFDDLDKRDHMGSTAMKRNSNKKKKSSSHTNYKKCNEKGEKGEKDYHCRHHSLKLTSPSSYTNINKKDTTGRTLLHKWARRGDKDQVKQLIDLGAEINSSDYAGWTPLHEACLHGHDHVVEILLDHGAQHQCQGLNGDTPLHDATENLHVQVIQQLLYYGADPFKMNSLDISPMMIAKKLNADDIVELFELSRLLKVGPSKTPFVQPKLTLISKQDSSSFTTKEEHCQTLPKIDNTNLADCTFKKRNGLVCASNHEPKQITLKEKQDEASVADAAATMIEKQEDHHYPHPHLKIETIEDPFTLLSIPASITPTTTITSPSPSTSSFCPSMISSRFHSHKTRTPIPTPPPESWHEIARNKLIKMEVEEEKEEKEEENNNDNYTFYDTISSLLLQPTLATTTAYFPLYMTTLNNERLWVVDYQIYLLLGGKGKEVNEKTYQQFILTYHSHWEKRIMTWIEKQQYWPYIEKMIFFYYHQMNKKKKNNDDGDDDDDTMISIMKNHFLSHPYYFIPLDQAISSLYSKKNNSFFTASLTTTKWMDIKYTPTLPPKMAMKLKKLNKL
ncbi:unnamed protein product [Cunninghamella echinulata]